MINRMLYIIKLWVIMALSEDFNRLELKVIVTAPILNLKKAGFKIRSHVNLNIADVFTFK